MSDSRDYGISEGVGQPRRDRRPAREWLLLVPAAVVAAFAAGAVIFSNFGARLAQQSVESDMEVLREELQGATQSLRETKLALRALQTTKAAAASGDAPSQAAASQKRLAGQLLVDQVLYARHWENLETNDKYKPVVKDLVKRLSKHAYSSRCISPQAADAPNAPRDEFERSILAQFLKERPTENRPILFAERSSVGQREYAYYQAVYAEKVCLLCHTKVSGVLELSGSSVAPAANVLGGIPETEGTPVKEGDLIAIVQVVLPDPPRSGR